MAEGPSGGAAAAVGRISRADYRNVSLMLALFTALLVYIGRLADEPAPAASRVLGPVFGMVFLVALVWLLMVIFRNLATMRGEKPSTYYVAYTGPAPADWIERPARAFNNLMQLPTLFYVVCVSMLVTQQLDRAQLAYAWLFVALRALHAIAYIGWNSLTYRFALWLMGSITLWILWVRFALQF